MRRTGAPAPGSPGSGGAPGVVPGLSTAARHGLEGGGAAAWCRRPQRVPIAAVALLAALLLLSMWTTWPMLSHTLLLGNESFNIGCPSPQQWADLTAATREARADSLGNLGGPDPERLPRCRAATLACFDAAPAGAAPHEELAELRANVMAPVTHYLRAPLTWGSPPKPDEFAGQVYVYTSPAIQALNAESALPASARRDWMDMFEADEMALNALLASSMVTEDPEAATFFFVPALTPHVYHAALLDHQNASVGMRRVRTYMRQLMRLVKAEGPYFARSGGWDHIVPATWGVGSYLFECCGGKDLAWMLENVTFWSPCGNTDALQVAPRLTPSRPFCHTFDRRRTVVLPSVVSSSKGEGGGAMPRDVAEALTNGDRLASSLWLGVFRGTATEEYHYSLGVRQGLLRMYGSCDEEGEGEPTGSPAMDAAPPGVPLVPRQGLIVGGRSSTFNDEVAKTVFMLSPEGLSPWTPRPLESLLGGALPVVFGEGALPLEDQVNWSAISVRLPNWAVGVAHAVLASIPRRTIAEMQVNVVSAADCLLWHGSSKGECIVRLALRSTLEKRNERKAGLEGSWWRR